jgi:glycosyltransferase involved in cell wall biosynthesis
MRVCFITGEYPPMTGGVGDYTRIIAHALARTGLERSVLTTSRHRTWLEPTSPVAPIYPIIRQWGFTSWPTILRILRHLAADVAHVQYQTAAYAMHPAVNLLPWWLRRVFPSLVIITTFHDLREPYLFPKAGRLRRWANEVLLRQSHGVVLTNAEDAYTARQWGVDVAGRQPLVRVIPIGPNVSPGATGDYHRQRWRQRFVLQSGSGGGYLIGYFGLINQSKGFDTLLRALRVVRDAGMTALLVVVGGGTGESDPTNQVYKHQMLQLAAKLQVARYIRWTGFLPEPEASACLRACDVCVLPYRDGASYRRGSLMAALVHGLPIVSTHGTVRPGAPLPSELGYLPELVDGQNCLLAPPDDPEALSQAIRRALSEADLARRVAAGALEVASAFSWQSIAEQHVGLYYELLHQRGGKVGDA